MAKVTYRKFVDRVRRLKFYKPYLNPLSRRLSRPVFKRAQEAVDYGEAVLARHKQIFGVAVK